MDYDWLYKDLFLDEFCQRFTWMEPLLQRQQADAARLIKETDCDQKDALSS